MATFVKLSTQFINVDNITRVTWDGPNLTTVYFNCLEQNGYSGNEIPLLGQRYTEIFGEDAAAFLRYLEDSLKDQD